MRYGYFDEVKKENMCITRPDNTGTVGKLSWLTRVWGNCFK